MNILRFFDPRDAAQPDFERIGRRASELVRAEGAGLQILSTFVIGAGAFNEYRLTGKLGDEVITGVLAFASQAEATELVIGPSTAEKLIGFPDPVKSAIDANHIRYLIERVYRSWSDSRTKVNRESRHLAPDQTYPSIIVQVPISPRTLSLCTRDPRTGDRTSAADYHYNVNNRIVDLKSEYATLMLKVEEIRRRPSQIDFEENGERLSIAGLGPQVMSVPALLGFARDQHSEGRLQEIEVLSIVEPRMLGSVVRTSYIFDSADSASFTGLRASPGVASGHIVWPGSSVEDAASRASIFVVRDASPDDVNILRNCVGAFSIRGGMISHLAVISRGLRIPAVTGLDQLHLDLRNREIWSDHGRLPRLFAAVDGNSGIVSLAGTPKMRSRQSFKASSSMSTIDWIDSLAQSVVEDGDFAALPLSLQTRIASLRQMITKIRAGHD